MSHDPTPAQGVGHDVHTSGVSPRASDSGTSMVLEHDRPDFQAINAAVAVDMRLSALARAFFFILSTRPNGWVFTMARIGELAGTGRDLTRATMKELKDAGYAVLKPRRVARGRCEGHTFVLHQMPIDTAPAGTPETPTDGGTDRRRHRQTAVQAVGDVLSNSQEYSTNDECGLNSPSDPIRIHLNSTTTPPIVPPAASSSLPSPSQLDGKDEKKKSSGGAKNRSGDDDPEFCEAWAVYPKRPTDSRTDAYRVWCARRKTGASGEDMLAGAKRYAAYISNTGKREYAMGASRFFGPGEYFRNDYDTSGGSATDRVLSGIDRDMQRAASTPAGLSTPTPPSSPAKHPLQHMLDPQPPEARMLFNLFMMRKEEALPLKAELGLLGQVIVDKARGYTYEPYPEEFDMLREMGQEVVK